MNKKDILLAAMAPANGKPHSPVQMQKLLFLIDKEVAPTIGGPFFDFVPYHYGPFDKTINHDLRLLSVEGYVEILGENTRRSYALTPTGQNKAAEILKGLPDPVADYITKISVFVRSLSFSLLVAAIYKAYPDMRVNSVFQG